MRKLMFLILICSPLSICAEEIDSAHVDVAYYADYQNNYRQGVSWYDREDYAMATYYFELAFRDHREDPLLAEYLYFSYLYMNRTMEVESVYPYLTRETKEKYGLHHMSSYSVYLEGGMLCNSEPEYSLPESTLYSENMALSTGSTYALAFEYTIGEDWRLTHGVSFCSSPSIQNVDSACHRITRNHTDYVQVGYSIAASYNLGRGWNLTPSAHVFYVKDHSCRVSLDSIKNEGSLDIDGGGESQDPYGDRYDKDDRYLPTYSYVNYFWYWNDRRGDDYRGWVPSNGAYSYWYVTEQRVDERVNYAVDLSLSKVYKRLLFSSSVSYMRYYGANSMKFGLEAVWYPKGNLNLYTHTKCYFINRETDGNVYAEEVVGFRTFPFCWMELGTSFGNMKYYSESHLSTLYTMQLNTKYRILANLIFPVSDRLSLYLLYRFVHKESDVYYLVDASKLERKSVPVYGNNVLGGIKWSF